MKKPKFTQAFTIVELTAVLVIMMIIASMIVGVGKRARMAALEAKAKSMIAALEVATSMFHADTGRYPTTDNGTGCPNLYDELTDTDHEPDNDGVIVEMGCAEGYILDNVGAPSTVRIGIDFSSGRIGRGRKKRPHIEFIEANFAEMDFPLADITLMPGCLEHIPFDMVRAQIDKAIAASKKVVLFDLPWWDGQLETFGSGIHLNPAHAWVCTPARLEYLMSGIDYEATFTSGQECIMIKVSK